jgi:hypothetical protein
MRMLMGIPVYCIKSKRLKRVGEDYTIPMKARDSKDSVNQRVIIQIIFHYRPMYTSIVRNHNNMVSFLAEIH